MIRLSFRVNLTISRHEFYVVAGLIDAKEPSGLR
jgi:hypothetical protein